MLLCVSFADLEFAIAAEDALKFMKDNNISMSTVKASCECTVTHGIASSSMSTYLKNLVEIYQIDDQGYNALDRFVTCNEKFFSFERFDHQDVTNGYLLILVQQNVDSKTYVTAIYQCIDSSILLGKTKLHSTYSSSFKNFLRYAAAQQFKYNGYVYGI